MIKKYTSLRPSLPPYARTCHTPKYPSTSAATTTRFRSEGCTAMAVTREGVSLAMSLFVCFFVMVMGDGRVTDGYTQHTPDTHTRTYYSLLLVQRQGGEARGVIHVGAGAGAGGGSGRGAVPPALALPCSSIIFVGLD